MRWMKRPLGLHTSTTRIYTLIVDEEIGKTMKEFRRSEM